MSDIQSEQLSSEPADVKGISQNRARASRFLYIFAWGLEIIAVTIGLAIGLSIILNSTSLHI